MSFQSWENFWKSEAGFFDDIMLVNTNYFADRFKIIFKPRDNSRILDYGCGPGYFYDCVRGTGAEIMNVDISRTFLLRHDEQAQKSFLQVTTDIESNRRIFTDNFREPFDYIVLLSVIQYFPSRNELERLIQLLSEHLQRGGSIVLADVIGTKQSPVIDVMSLLYHSTIQGKLFAFFRFLYCLFFTSYRKIFRDAGQLKLEANEVQAICQRLGLKFERVDGLTIHRSRTNYVLTRDK